MAEATVEKKSLMDKFTDVIMKFAGPLNKFAKFPAIQAIQNGLSGVMPIIIIGSFSLIIYLLGTDYIGGVVLVPFLSNYTDQLSVINTLTMSMLSIYASISIPMCYAEQLGLDVKTCGLLGLVVFFTFFYNGTVDGMLDVTPMSATGLFPVMVSTLVAVRIYKFFIDRNITIKLPDSVPPAIGNAFTSLIPYAVVIVICWFIRTMLNFDAVTFLTTFLTPYISAADNLGMYVLDRTVSAVLWSVGLHGDNMWTTPIFQSFQLIWTDENAAALAAGEELPHVWTYCGVDRISTWPGTVWPLILLMITSRVDYLRKLGWACLPSAIFTIVEPVIFGLPLALNAYLMLPFIVISIIVAIFSYTMISSGFVSKFYASLPWATPPFILGPLGTGDWKTLLITGGAFLIGLVIYYPFWRMYENSILKEQEEKEAAAQGEAQPALSE